MKVFYRKKADAEIKLKPLPITSEKEAAFKVAFSIKVAEEIEDSMRVLIYDNKTGELYLDNDLIMRDSFLEYEAIS